MNRAIPGYDDWFMDIAKVVAARSTCSRRAVGCVIVSKSNHILATGYNGVPSGIEHCTSTPCAGSSFATGEGLDSCQALHAEQNAIARLIDAEKAHTLYCTTAPCISCTKLISATSIQRIVCDVPYKKSGQQFWVEVLGRDWSEML